MSITTMSTTLCPSNCLRQPSYKVTIVHDDSSLSADTTYQSSHRPIAACKWLGRLRTTCGTICVLTPAQSSWAQILTLRYRWDRWTRLRLWLSLMIGVWRCLRPHCQLTGEPL